MRLFQATDIPWLSDQHRGCASLPSFVFTPLNSVKKSEMRESHGSLIPMGMFSSSFDTMLLLSLQAKSFGFSFFSFCPFLEYNSLQTQSPSLMLVALHCMINFLRIIKDLRTKKRVQSWRMGHTKAVTGWILQNACVSSDLPGLIRPSECESVISSTLLTLEHLTHQMLSALMCSPTALNKSAHNKLQPPPLLVSAAYSTVMRLVETWVCRQRQLFVSFT